MILTDTVLAEAVKRTPTQVKEWVKPLNDYLPYYGILTTEEVATFLACLAHETNGLRWLKESFNYTPEGLAATFPSKFRGSDGKPNALAFELGRHSGKKADQRQIANTVYGGRYGNNDEDDGWLYRGRGMGITFKDNYRMVSEFMQLRRLLTRPQLLEQPQYAVLSAIAFWIHNGLDKHDHDMDISQEARIIQGSGFHTEKREAWLSHLLTTFGVEGSDYV